jgi:hypothetical protein
MTMGSTTPVNPGGREPARSPLRWVAVWVCRMTDCKCPCHFDYDVCRSCATVKCDACRHLEALGY